MKEPRFSLLVVEFSCDSYVAVGASPEQMHLAWLWLSERIPEDRPGVVGWRMLLDMVRIFDRDLSLEFRLRWC